MVNGKKTYGECRICGRIGALTDDHVPPKFWNNGMIKYYSQALGMKDPDKAKTLFPWQARKGIVYHTICEKCNNELLGGNADNALKEFIDMIKSGQSACESNILNCNVYVNRVARAVVGHLLSAKDYFDDTTKIDKKLRDYFLNTNTLPPKDMQLFFFYYPYNYIVVARDIVIINSNGAKNLISCLYSYPVAFILSCDGKNLDTKLDNLFSYCTEDIDEKKNVQFDYSSVIDQQTNSFKDYAWPINGALCVVAGKSIESQKTAKGFK